MVSLRIREKENVTNTKMVNISCQSFQVHRAKPSENLLEKCKKAINRS